MAPDCDSRASAHRQATTRRLGDLGSTPRPAGEWQRSSLGLFRPLRKALVIGRYRDTGLAQVRI